LDPRTIQHGETGDQWIHIFGNAMSCVGLLQAGILVNKCLRQKLAPFGYYKHINTQGLWYHEPWPISFTLVVDNFGVKYKTKNNIKHLIGAIASTYNLTKDWTSNLYCGITLD
jgi:hypothetical protein